MWILKFIDNFFGGNRPEKKVLPVKKHDPTVNAAREGITKMIEQLDEMLNDDDISMCSDCGSDLEDDGTCGTCGWHECSCPEPNYEKRLKEYREKYGKRADLFTEEMFTDETHEKHRLDVLNKLNECYAVADWKYIECLHQSKEHGQCMCYNVECLYPDDPTICEFSVPKWNGKKRELENSCFMCACVDNYKCEMCSNDENNYPHFIKKEQRSQGVLEYDFPKRIIKHGEIGSNGIHNATGHDHIENEDGTWEDLKKDDVFTTINDMSDDELHEAVEKTKSKMEGNKCYPNDCEGQCQGTGWCHVAVDFRNKIYPPMVTTNEIIDNVKKKKKRHKKGRKNRKKNRKKN